MGYDPESDGDGFTEKPPAIDGGAAPGPRGDRHRGRGKRRSYKKLSDRVTVNQSLIASELSYTYHSITLDVKVK